MTISQRLFRERRLKRIARQSLPELCKLATDGDRAMLRGLLAHGFTAENIVFIGDCDKESQSHFISLVKPSVMESFVKSCLTTWKERNNAAI